MSRAHRGESKRLGIPRVRRSGWLVQALGRLHVVPLGKGVARHTTCSDPSAKKDKRVHLGATACTREEHLHHSHNTHRRSHSGTPHAQHSDACTVFHVSAFACGAGVFSSATNLPDLLPGRPAALCQEWPEQYSARHTTCSDPSAKKDKRVHLGAQRVHVKNTCTTATTPTGAPFSLSPFLPFSLSPFLPFSLSPFLTITDADQAGQLSISGAKTARILRTPEPPTDAARMAHNETHIPFGDWCPICVASRGRSSPHRRVIMNKTADTLPKF